MVSILLLRVPAREASVKGSACDGIYINHTQCRASHTVPRRLESRGWTNIILSLTSTLKLVSLHRQTPYNTPITFLAPNFMPKVLLGFMLASNHTMSNALILLQLEISLPDSFLTHVVYCYIINAMFRSSLNIASNAAPLN